MKETWLPVDEYPGYEVSSRGRVRSLERRVTQSNGYSRRVPGRVLKPSANSNGRLHVSLYRGGQMEQRTIHRLVCEAFHGKAPEDKPWALHRDGDHLNNQPENLYWGTPQDNVDDMMRHGTHAQLRETHCPRGHEKTSENWYVRPTGRGGMCKECQKLRSEQARKTPLELDSPLHGSSYGYGARGCRCEPCKDAAKKARSKFAYVELPPGDYRHGLTGAFNYKCKCPVCLTAAREHYARTRAKKKAKREEP